MTPEQGYEAARYALVGHVVSMGAECSKMIRVDESISQRANERLAQKFPFSTWDQYDWWRRLGFVPSMWALCFASGVSDVSDDEMRWLHSYKTSLAEAVAWREKRMMVD